METPVTPLLEKDLPENKGGKVKLDGAYETYMGRRGGQKVWVVNWHFVSSKLYSAFIMGGNDQRYRFNPLNEVWIDSTMGIEEYEYTVEHELLEREKMRSLGWSYNRAHDFASATLDVALRKRNRRRIQTKLNSLRKQPRFAHLVEKLEMIYRAYLCTSQGLKVWVVDGSRVREHMELDFAFAGGCDLSYPFIPEREIWLDSATSCGTLKFALVQQIAQRQLLANRVPGGDAYTQSVVAREQERLRQEKLCRRHEATLPPMPVGVRHRGVKPKV